MLVPSKTGKLPRTEFSGANDAGNGAHTDVAGVQLVANPRRPPKAAGCVPVVATAEEAPVAKRYWARNWKRGSVGGKNRALALAAKNSACAGVTWKVPTPGTASGVSPKLLAPMLEKPVPCRRVFSNDKK